MMIAENKSEVLSEWLSDVPEESKNNFIEIIREYIWYMQELGKWSKSICYKEKDSRYGDGYFTQYELNGNELVVEWECTWAYGGHDETSFRIPISIFYDNSWKKELDVELEKKKKEDTRKERENDYKIYKGLKEKWNFE